MLFLAFNNEIEVPFSCTIESPNVLGKTVENGPMCGRFTQLLTWQQVHCLYETAATEVPSLLQPRYNGAPTQNFAICCMDVKAGRTVRLLRWGLVPFWAKDISMGSRLINARAETVHEKPSFRNSFKSRRCLIPADGWFEWQSQKGGKQPYFLTAADEGPLSFAGLWDSWAKEGHVWKTFTIITTQACPDLHEVHHRQPAIIRPQDFDAWLDPETPADSLLQLVRLPNEGPFDIRVVSKRVNNPRNDDPDVLQPLSG